MFKKITKNLNTISKTQKIFLIFSAFVATAWLIASFYIFSKEDVVFLTIAQIDKLIHSCGGLVVAGVLSVLLGQKNKKIIIAGVIIIGVLWEMWEVFYIGYQHNLVRQQFCFWLLDSSTDIIFDIAGAFFWLKISSK